MIRIMSTRRRAAIGVMIVGFALTGASGCMAWPDQRLSQCSQLSKTLQAENSELRDSDYKLRAANSELARQTSEARERLSEQNRRIQALERSVLAYQRDRDQMEQAFADIRRQVTEETQTALLPEASSLP